MLRKFGDKVLTVVAYAIAIVWFIGSLLASAIMSIVAFVILGVYKITKSDWVLDKGMYVAAIIAKMLEIFDMDERLDENLRKRGTNEKMIAEAKRNIKQYQHKLGMK